MDPPFLRPFWRYYGGKWKAAPRYPAPLHDTIVEPFAGAAGYSLRHYNKRVVLVEKFEVVAQLWKWLVAVDEAEVLRIPEVDHVDELPGWVSPEGRALVGFAMNAATTAPCKQLSAGRRRLREMGRPYEGWSSAFRDRLAGQLRHIRHWVVVHGDYSQAPRVEATWFVDPPYQQRGQHYKHGSAGIDYAELAGWCRSLPGQVMVCENAGATWLPFESFATFKSSAMSRKIGTSEEVLWRNAKLLPSRPLDGSHTLAHDESHEH